MSNEQAVQILISMRNMMCDQNGCPISDAVFALDKAIEALSADRPQEKMSDPIRREDAIGAINGWLKQNGFPNLGDGILYLVPSTDRPQGENLRKKYPTLFECSLCGASCDDTVPWDCDINFCPNCGADMRERESE